MFCVFHYQLSSTSKVWQDSGAKVHGVMPSKISAAKRFISGLSSDGGTNIYDSLTQVVVTTSRERGIHGEMTHLRMRGAARFRAHRGGF